MIYHNLRDIFLGKNDASTSGSFVHFTRLASASKLKHSFDLNKGEIWFEIETETGELVSDPVCFTPSMAHATLAATGMSDSEAVHLLSNDYARQWLTDYYASGGRIWPV